MIVALNNHRRHERSRRCADGCVYCIVVVVNFFLFLRLLIMAIVMVKDGDAVAFLHLFVSSPLLFSCTIISLFL